MKPHALLVALVVPVSLVAAPVPKRPPPSETVIVLTDSLDKPTWKLRAAVKWRVNASQPGGVLIEDWDFSGSVAAMPRDEIKNRVKFSKIEPWATAWLDVPGERFVLVDEIKPVKDSWQERGTLDIKGSIVRTGYHSLEARIWDWENPKKRFEFRICEVNKDGVITNANLKGNDNGTVSHASGTVAFTLASPDGETVYTRASVWFGFAYWSSELQPHSDWEMRGSKDISKWLTVEYAFSNRK